MNDGMQDRPRPTPPGHGDPNAANDHEDGAEPEAGAPGQLDAGAPDAAEAPDRTAALQEEVGRLKDQLLRTLAETENQRRRLEREREDTTKYAVSAMARDLLSVADNLRRALESVPSDMHESHPMKPLVTGVEATERELLATFERRGIKRIDPMGERFDPNFHQAMFEVPQGDHPPGTIVQVLQPGYVIHDRLLRPALVGIAKEPPGSRINTTA